MRKISNLRTGLSNVFLARQRRISRTEAEPMKVFHCDHCQHLVFFENVRCVKCDHSLAYLPDLCGVGSLEPIGGDFRSPLPQATGRRYRLCRNYTAENVCNWAIAADDPNPLCRSCRLTAVIPDLSVAGNRE